MQAHESLLSDVFIIRGLSGGPKIKQYIWAKCACKLAGVRQTKGVIGLDSFRGKLLEI